ncbi:HAUS augmin-like complex subunit 4-domain-containing protein [Fennellomyces sp. T-0311]|nr:HAUS augmin-like complex subunit 4-domain-containing protein [Fennellomyces sp. T-0311]
MDRHAETIVDRIQRDHFSNTFVRRDIEQKMNNFQQEHIQPYLETRLLLSEIQSLINNPDRAKDLSGEEREYVESILYRPSNEAPHRHYAEHVFGLTENDLSVPTVHVKDKLNKHVDLALQEKYNQVHRLASIYQESDTVNADAVQLVEEKQQSLHRMRVNLPAKRALLTRLATRFVKITLEVLDTVWSIIKEFKSSEEQAKNRELDAYYCALTDSLLLRIKILHMSTLLATYDSQLASALRSLRALLENRYIEVKTQLSFTEKRLKAYHDLGPEFETLASAYFKLLDEIKATEDDIDKIKAN